MPAASGSVCSADRRRPGLGCVSLVLAPGEHLAFERAAWRDTLVEVDDGQLDLELRSGAYRRFGVGALLWLDGLGLRALHNRGQQIAVLVAVSRTRPTRGSGCTATEAGDERTQDRRLNGHDDHDSRPDRRF
jgi:hypothetical protein